MSTENNQQPPETGGQTRPAKKKIIGSIWPNKENLGAHLDTKKVALATGVGLVGVGLIAFLAIDLLDNMGGASQHQTTAIHTKVPTISVPKRESQEIQTPGPKTPSSSPAKPGTAAAPAVPIGAAQPTKEPPQDKSLMQALQGAKPVSWSADAGATAPAPEASNVSDLEKQLLALQTMGLKAGEKPDKKKAKKAGIYDHHLVREEISPYELLQGSVIPATLDMGIKSDIAGEVTAVVSQPVYNSLNDSYVLIPAGSRLIGQYKNHVAMGQTRILVDWTRVEFPNGTYMQLGHMGGAAPDGYAGFHDHVDDHTWSIFKNALLLSLIDVGMAMSSPVSTSNNTTGVTGNEALQNGEQALAQTFGQAEAQLFQRYINVSPTLTIPPGYAFDVVVTRDMIFPGPYQHGVNLVGTNQQGQAAAPKEADPYILR